MCIRVLVECVFIGRNYFLARYDQYVWIIGERILMQLRIHNVTLGCDHASGGIPKPAAVQLVVKSEQETEKKTPMTPHH